MDVAPAAARSLGSLLERMGDPLDPDAYDWPEPRRRRGPAPHEGLTDDERFQLTYAAQVEWGTEGTFASLDTARDPLITRFLRTWLDQEVVHGELLARVLRSDGGRVEPAHVTPAQRRAARRGRHVNRLARVALGDDFTALHMAWGAVNELTTLRFYGLLRDRTGSTLLRDVLRDVMAQESLHYAFYRQAAIERLDGNPRGQRVVRFGLAHLWSPVGVGLRSREDADRLLHGLFEPAPTVVQRIDAAIGTIPGLAGLDLIGGCLRRA
ncbi:ferritin-like domain-containing protein [Dermatobacter hominis]|uniref:ferritin-like domain-containing protein n=1 Tax=Dermatobacter hominis TaxID=2884263 RepID=UPI001D10F6F2|nr:ferritin-like domain-containing protein [Dermatobacter hominis]UDY35317.1 ferritin-like domain-containing protein [Dermatobacter hominis]